MGIVVFPYLDSWLLKGNFFSEVRSDTSESLALFLSLGLHLSAEKSSLIPVQHRDLIRAMLDSVTSREYLPTGGCDAMSSLICMIQQSPQTTEGSCLQLLGHM